MGGMGGVDASRLRVTTPALTTCTARYLFIHIGGARMTVGESDLV